MRALPVTILVSLATAAPAVAQDEGVTIDPESPSAKEYAIPLERERQQADPGRDPGARIEQGSRTSPLFGEGIEPQQRASRAGTSASGAGSDTSGGGGGTASGGSRPARGSEPPRGTSSRQPVTEASTGEVLRATSNPGAPAGGLDTALIIGAVAAVVLAVGGGAGLLLRRRS